MDELVIGEKKYLSSKQAAKITGYAKDYVGQLCREGRVPARLVGRSWYVLESAIHDHRFGEKDSSAAVEKQDFKTPVSTWESPRYESSTADEVLPSVNRLRNEEESSSEKESAQSTQEDHRLQDTWQAWFDKFESVIQHTQVPEDPPFAVETEKQKEEEEEAPVPIRAIYNTHYTPDATIETRRAREYPSVLREEVADEGTTERAGLQRVLGGVKIVGALAALVLAATAVFGSGYFDSYVISNKTVSLVAGVSLYNK